MEAIWLYSLHEWGLAQADKYIDHLTDAFAFLASRPTAGMQCQNIRVGYRKFPVIRHVVYYRKADYGIEVVRVLHDRMLASRHLF